MNALRTAAAALSLTLSACLAAPPLSQVEASAGLVRADSPSQAAAIGVLLDDLQPRLLEMLPGSREVNGLEVWLQERPRLYATTGEAAHDAEGLWAESHSRILLSETADDIERTLAHELVHAHLDSDWHPLPGTLEEGLCDYLSARLAPEGAARLRAGRLSSAALACGGIRLELTVRRPGTDVFWSARITLSGEDLGPDPQRDVFRLAAGLSTTSVSSAAKRSYYGIAYLIVERVIERRTLAGLYGLCRRAESNGFGRVPRPWLLEAANLTDDRDAFRLAAVEALGADELAALVEMHPSFVSDALAGLVRDTRVSATTAAELEALDVELTLVEGQGSIRLSDHPRLRDLVLAQLQAH